MKNSFGNALGLTVFGESHGTAVGAVLDGIAPGIPVDFGYINEKLALRKADGEISTSRTETDEVKILSGVLDGYTTGTPLTVIIENENICSDDYDSTLARPGHADLTAHCKYHGFEDRRGGGHFSGRLTAPVVAVCSILEYALEQKSIFIGSHIKRSGGIFDRDFESAADDIKALAKTRFPVLDTSAGEKMKAAILEAKKSGDSIGGILETAVSGLPAGVGEPWFDSFESVLSHLMFSVPAVKGIEFGAGFCFAGMRGSEANDRMINENGKIKYLSNSNGGIIGGITTGNDVIFRTVIKPTPSVSVPQETVDIKTLENGIIKTDGRHDPAIFHRARPVIDALTAFACADLLTVRFGTDYLK